MLSRRIIACLDVKDGKVVKGVRFRDHAVAGDIVELALRYRDAGADELVFYDISASPEGRMLDVAWVERVARGIDIPFCVAGGIRSVWDARAVLHAGADKISVNSPALERPALIGELAAAFGVQCVVVGIDSLRDDDGEWRVRQYTGDATRMRASARRTLDWIREAQQRGAGEIVLNCMGSDGVRAGYDIEQLRAARALCRVPLVASGGAGTREHFRDVFAGADVDGALAASVFHSGRIAIPELKRWLWQQGINMRPPAGVGPAWGKARASKAGMPA
jgi:cyclase